MDDNFPIKNSLQKLETPEKLSHPRTFCAVDPDFDVNGTVRLEEMERSQVAREVSKRRVFLQNLNNNNPA